jgi:histidine triad (HIT) family protein
MASIFTRIINGELPCYRIAEDDLFLAFLDIEPLRRGHVLIVPKQEIDKVYDAPDEYLQQWLLFAQPIARAIERSFDCRRCGISFIGLEVPHAHMHLVPINTADDLNFTRKPVKPSEDELKADQARLLAGMNV